MQKGFATLYIVVIAAIVLAAGAFFVYSGDSSPEVPQTPASTSQNGPSGISQLTPPSIRESESVLEADLVDVSGGDSSGTGYILRSTDLQHEVEATLPDPEGTTFYEGWLVQQSPLDFISTGVMEKNEEGMFILNYQDSDLYEGYDFVVITLETVKDETPEKHIIEGTAI